MPAGQRSGSELLEYTLVADAARIREQLNRLLAHPLFANSKRYPALLAYAVEQTLLGHASELKERSIGVEVFGKTPTYDTNADPVVRITAGEVRKRLTQYYYDPSHRGELSIELPTGSYIPFFREAERMPELPVTELAPEALQAAAEPLAPGPGRLWRMRWKLATGTGLVVVLAAATGLMAGWRFHTDPPPPPPSNIELFWEPVTGSVNPTTFCLGEPAKNLDVGSINSFDTPVNSSKPEPLYFRLHYSGNLALADVITLTRTVAALASRHKAFRVVPASEATFAQLREGPVVLIGAFDNIWTLRVTQKLRFGFESKDGVALLVDRNSSSKTTWATAWDLPYQKLSRDYAIVARIHDQTTGQPVIIAAGISEEGTEAAGEILYNPEYLDSLIARAPHDWMDKNMEAVIETQVIEGHPGPPNILAVETW
ncbi:MAG TPA: hypothetical protein VG267_08165 [Terracidiphilus sp.]|jgi:hypothetical protein|nr:hypothetical protein [Terracidiphilus sp.]